MFHALALNTVILIRIAAAIVFGFGIGLEREMTNKYAGLRTHILVCLGACVFTILSLYGFPNITNQGQPYGDHARVAAQIITGIGFIGGGTVLRHGSSVYGLTTAATLWVAASIGMACGTGMIYVALITTIFSVAVLVLIRFFERNVLVKSTKNVIRIKTTVLCKEENADRIYNCMFESFERLHEISRKQDIKENDMVKIVVVADVNGKKQLEVLYKKFNNLEGLNSISIQEDDE